MFDIVRDILMRVQSVESSFTDYMAAEIERQVRMDYGGETAKIATLNETDRRERNRRIIDALEKGGVTHDQLAQRFGVNRSRITQIWREYQVSRAEKS